MNLRHITLTLALGLALAASAAESVSSPGGTVTLHFDVQTDGIPVYSVDFKGREVIKSSRLGLDLASENSRHEFTGDVTQGHRPDHLSLTQIGRASCRERVLTTV